MILEKIEKPNDLKKLTVTELNTLSGEVREFILDSLSKTGGHLASNLGVVELTIALHYSMNLPEDKLIWDVGHQCYTHKLLTNRRKAFNSLRKKDGLSGFPNLKESEFDAFGTGHATTSISAGVGLAIGSEIKNEDKKVVTVIGDGSLTGGMAYEALNHLGRTKANMLIILNDNQMSISENVGGVSNSLKNIRFKKKYLKTKKELNKFLNKIPVIGNKTYNFLGNTKDIVKHLVIENTIFDSMGIKYFGIVDGHNLKELIYAIDSVLTLEGPVLLHVSTQKGKGYKYAEDNPTKYHGVPDFKIELGIENNKKEYTFSNCLVDTLVELAKDNKKILTLTAAMSEGTGLKKFKSLYPKRFIDVGIAEQHLVTLAGGLSLKGLIPFIAIYSTFLQRGYDQIIHDICLQKLHVVFCIDRAGIVGEDGATHQGVFDIAFLSHIPNITIIAPSNKKELIEIIKYAVKTKETIAIRYPKGRITNILEEKNIDIIKGSSNTLIKGKRIAILSVGSMLDEVHRAYNLLVKKKINPTIINLIFIKPIDLEMIKSLRQYKYVVVVEDGIKRGGVSSIILEYMNEFDIKTKVIPISYRDEFIEHGTRKELLAEKGLEGKKIYEEILKLR